MKEKFLFFILSVLCLPTGRILAQGFVEGQESFPRVRAARLAHGDSVRASFLRKGMKYPPAGIFLRAFKRERTLELWARGEGQDEFQLIKAYPICAMSGHLGPKREQDDEQVPEGFYSITQLNPVSEFHLSPRVNYPNDVDRSLGHKAHLGGDIFIHGGCDTIGCIPLTDEGIEELYLVVTDVISLGAGPVPVHIFPTHLTDDVFSSFERSKVSASLLFFWANLKRGFDFFEARHRLPHLACRNGSYLFF